MDNLHKIHQKGECIHLTEYEVKRCHNWWRPSLLYHNQLGWTGFLYFIATTTLFDWIEYTIFWGIWEVFHQSHTWVFGSDIRPFTPHNTSPLTTQHQYPSIASVLRGFHSIIGLLTASFRTDAIDPAADDLIYYSVITYIWHEIIKNDNQHRSW